MQYPEKCRRITKMPK